jgi:hypothetical protein
VYFPVIVERWVLNNLTGLPHDSGGLNILSQFHI